jgi:GxxExxY protein
LGRNFSALSKSVIGAAIEVHRTLGPGLLESTYKQCLAHELKLNIIDFKMEYPLPLEYKGVYIDCAYRIDLLIENQIILELKCVDQLKEFMKLNCLHI